MTTEYTKQDEPGRRCNADRRPASSINLSLLSGGSLADYDYWPTNRVQTITHTDSAAATISRFSYQYDANGNRTQQIEEQGGVTETTTYVYRAQDDIDRLESFTVTDGVTTSTTDYTFEGYNRKTEQVTVDTLLTVDKTYAYDETNWLDTVTDAVSGATITYTYDNNGNTTLKADSSQPGQEMVFDYDVANRLVQTAQGASLLGQYDYNASGMRVRHYGSERGDVEYFYDDGAVLEEYVAGAGGGLLAHYRYGDRLLSLDTGAETQYYHHDALGSTVNLTDGAGLTKVRYTLDPWGHIRSQAGTSVNRQIFTGQEHDEQTGLIYFGARYYDPDTGRFISQDSYLGEPGTPPSLHRYLYAYSNPTVYVDLMGYASEDRWAGFGAPGGPSLLGMAWDWTQEKISGSAGEVVDYSLEKTREQGDFIDTGGPYPTLNPWHTVGFTAQVVESDPELLMVPLALKSVKIGAEAIQGIKANKKFFETNLAPKITTEAEGVPSITGNAVDLAKSWQTQFPYVRQDPMKAIELSKGKILGQVVFDADAGPAGSYFTTPSAIRRAKLADGSIDANILNQGLQIDGSKYLNFRANVQFFQVDNAVPFGEAAFGRATANQHLNPDGFNALPQVFLKEDFLQNLKPIDMSGNPAVKAYPMVNTETPKYLFERLPEK